MLLKKLDNKRYQRKMKTRASSAWCAHEEQYKGCENAVARLEFLAENEEDEKFLATLLDNYEKGLPDKDAAFTGFTICDMLWRDPDSQEAIDPHTLKQAFEDAWSKWFRTRKQTI